MVQAGQVFEAGVGTFTQYRVELGKSEKIRTLVVDEEKRLRRKY